MSLNRTPTHIISDFLHEIRQEERQINLGLINQLCKELVKKQALQESFLIPSTMSPIEEELPFQLLHASIMLIRDAEQRRAVINILLNHDGSMIDELSLELAQVLKDFKTLEFLKQKKAADEEAYQQSFWGIVSRPVVHLGLLGALQGCLIMVACICLLVLSGGLPLYLMAAGGALVGGTAALGSTVAVGGVAGLVISGCTAIGMALGSLEQARRESEELDKRLRSPVVKFGGIAAFVGILLFCIVLGVTAGVAVGTTGGLAAIPLVGGALAATTSGLAMLLGLSSAIVATASTFGLIGMGIGGIYMKVTDDGAENKIPPNHHPQTESPSPKNGSTRQIEKAIDSKKIIVDDSTPSVEERPSSSQGDIAVSNVQEHDPAMSSCVKPTIGSPGKRF